jgi:hypothetical protein
MGGFSALCNCASHERCRRCETVSHNGANEQKTKTRDIRGQQRQWLCFCGRQKASDIVVWPLLQTEWLSRTAAAAFLPSFKKRSSFSSQPIAPSSGPEIAVVSTLHSCDKKPHLVVAQTVVGAPE